MARVLVVDDSKLDRLLAEELLSEISTMTVECVEDAAKALRVMAARPPDVVLADLVMPEMSGIELVTELRRRRPGLPVVLMTSRGSEEVAVKALTATWPCETA